MKRLFKRWFFVFLGFFLIIPFNIYALEKPTHFELNGKIVDISGLDSYLKDTKIFLGGVGETINGYTIRDWIQDGGKAEDEPFYTRSFNHFHNPLKPWDSAGFKGTFKSAILWAQEQGTFGSLFGGNYSWKAVREYYHIALTGRDLSGAIVASTQDDRGKYFGYTFQGVGQLMHLVEDMSVPAHTRDDAHVLYNYEDKVDEIRRTNLGDFQNLLSTPVYFGNAIQNISTLFDTDQYNGTNPPSGNAIGLSEYTNANFFSEDTINNSNFPNPKISDTTTTIVERNFTNTFWNTTYLRQYYLKNCCGETNNNQGYFISAVDYLDYYRLQYPTLSFALPKIPVLDNNVYSDYASLLLPRAVGYSAGLLNYFFRGEITEITI